MSSSNQPYPTIKKGQGESIHIQVYEMDKIMQKTMPWDLQKYSKDKRISLSEWDPAGNFKTEYSKIVKPLKKVPIISKPSFLAYSQFPTFWSGQYFNKYYETLHYNIKHHAGLIPILKNQQTVFSLRSSAEPRDKLCPVS